MLGRFGVALLLGEPGSNTGVEPSGRSLNYRFVHSMKNTKSESLFYPFQEQLLPDTQGTFQGPCKPTDSCAYQVGGKAVFKEIKSLLPHQLTTGSTIRAKVVGNTFSDRHGSLGCVFRKIQEIRLEMGR